MPRPTVDDRQYRWYLLDPEQHDGLGELLKFRSQDERDAFVRYQNRTRQRPGRIECLPIAEADALQAMAEHDVPVNRAGWL